MTRRLPFAAAAVALTLLGAACGGSSTSVLPPVQVDAPSVTPAGSGPYQPTGGTAVQSCGNVQSSLPPLAQLPAAGQMPAGTFEATILKRGYLIAGVDQSTYLFGYRDPSTGQLSGFDIDMVDQVAQAIFGKVTASDVHYVIVPNADRIADVENGTVDIVAETMTITCSRRQQADFSSVYLLANERILVPTSTRDINSTKDLAGKRVCATVGSDSLTNIAALNLSPPPKLIQVLNQSDCLVMLQQGQVDAVSTDDTILEGLAAQDPNVKLVGPGFSSEPYGMAISQKNPDFVAFVNAVLAGERADGTWTSIYTHWLGPYGPVPAPPAASYSPTAYPTS